MGYKKLGKDISFADLAIKKSMEHNRSVKMMERINRVVSWKNIEALLMEHYKVGTSKEGADEVHAALEMSMTWRTQFGMGSILPQILSLRTRLIIVFHLRSF